MDSLEVVLGSNVAQAHARYQAEHAQLHEHDVEYFPGFPPEGQYRSFRNQSRVECLSKDCFCCSVTCHEHDAKYSN